MMNPPPSDTPPTCAKHLTRRGEPQPMRWARDNGRYECPTCNIERAMRSWQRRRDRAEKWSRR